MPDFAIGDAFGIGMLTVLNDELFQQGLTQVDRRSIGDGDSTATTWREWAFVPMRFEGTVKHQLAQLVRTSFQGRHAVLRRSEEHTSGLQSRMRLTYDVFC